jgi:signal transduction histidine kinase
VSRTDCPKSSSSPRQRLAAAEAERARWARQLYDGTLQGLGELRLSLAAMEGADPFAVQELLQSAIADLEREVERLRALIVDLRPVALDRDGIGPAIELLADRVERPKLEVMTRIELGPAGGPGAVRFDGECETVVYRIVQAALDNTVRHAEATRVVVEVVRDAGREEVVVMVSDDGNGFDPAREAEGNGLVTMRERIDLLGGSLEIRSGIDEGTVVCAAVPSRRGISPSVSAN